MAGEESAARPDVGEWEFVFVLPNLVLPQLGDASTGRWPAGLTLCGTDTFVVAGAKDARVVRIAEASPGVARVLGAFHTNLGKAYDPAVLLARTDLKYSDKLDGESAVAFRNALAFPFLLRARAATIQPDGYAEPTYSDVFAFHPAMPTDSGGIVTVGEGLRAHYATTQRVIFTPTPQVSSPSSGLFPDDYLRRALSQLWREAYEDAVSDEFHRSVLRSLEVAYIACSTSAFNQGALTDYGAYLALWVSALETLAWPAENRGNFKAVHALLGSYEWARPALNATYSSERLRNTTYPSRRYSTFTS